MKKGLIIVIVVLVLYPAASWLMGYSIEHRIDDSLKQLGERTPYVKIIDSHFHRGWFVSEQDVTVQVQVLGVVANSTPLSISIHSVIHHGPICGIKCLGLARVESHLVFSDRIQPLLASIFGASEPLSVSSKLSFFGGGSVTFSSPAIKNAALPNGDHVSSDGFTLNGSYGSHFDSYTVTGSLPHMVYTAARGQSFEVSAIDIDASAKQALRTLYVGDTSVAIGRAAFGIAGSAGAFSAHDLLFQSHSSLTDGFMMATVKYGLGGVTTAPLTLTSTHFDLTLRHLDAESLELLTAAMRDANQDASVPPAARISKMMSVLKSPMISLLSHQPEISLDRISIATATGSALLTGIVKVHGVDAKDFVDGADPKVLVQKLDADLDLTLDDGLLSGLPGGVDSAAKLQAFVGQGLLTHEGGKFHTAIGLHQGQTTFNGKPFGPPMAAPK